MAAQMAATQPAHEVTLQCVCRGQMLAALPPVNRADRIAAFQQHSAVWCVALLAGVPFADDSL